MKASFTIEAALLMPIIILLFAWMLHLTIGLYERTTEAADAWEQVEEIDSAGLFRQYAWTHEMLDDFLDPGS